MQGPGKLVLSQDPAFSGSILPGLAQWVTTWHFPIRHGVPPQMRNFLRCVRAACPYRRRLLLSLACAILAAVFWSMNFLAFHPVLKILGGAKSLSESVQVEIDQLRTDAQSHRDKLERLRADLANPPGNLSEDEHKQLAGRIDLAEWKVRRNNLALYRLQLLKTFYSKYLPADRFTALVWLLFAFVIFIGCKGLFEFIQESLVGSATNRTICDLRNVLYRGAIRQDLGHFGETGSHDLTSRLTIDMEVLGAGLKTLFGKVISEPLRAIGCVVVACFISWRLTALFLILVPIGVYVMARTGRVMKRASKRHLERMSDVYKILQESFQGIRVVKAFAMEPFERLRFRAAARELYRKAMRVVNIDAISGPLIEVMGIAGVATALLAGAYLVINQRNDLLGIRFTSTPLDNETLLTFYALMAAIADPLRKLSSVYTRLHTAAAAADRLYAEVDRTPRISRNGMGERLPLHQRRVEFRDVGFSYEPGRAVLSNVNLTIPFGETVALVGRNGCGKTTLLSLLPRFFDPDHGRVLIDDIDIRQANLRSLRRQIAIVTQETILFDDTIARNIAYGRRHARREQIEEAARKAFAHDFIEKLPRGYETRVGELARSLSGGERQRIALARAILRNPTILLLDEFSSQIDAESEAKIHVALKEFAKGRTTILITHRLHTLEVADRIVVLEGGRIEAVGTHEQLLALSEAYRGLHDAGRERKAA